MDSKPAFRFTLQPEHPNINIDFIKKYDGWLNNISESDKIKYKITELFSNYKSKDFCLINNELHYLYSNTLTFFTPTDTYKTIKIYNDLILLRNFINKIVSKYIRLKLLKVYHKNWEISNKIDLSLNKFSSSDSDIIFINDYNLKKIYSFRASEIINIYRFSLEYNNEGTPLPINPKNPYTNECFTLKQHYEIYNCLLKYFFKRYKTLPEIYILFKNSYFSKDIFASKSIIYLVSRNTRIYVSNLTFNEWLYEINDFAENIRGFCFSCFKKKKNIRYLCKNILELFILNENDIYYYGDAIAEFKKILSENLLIFGKRHNIVHRRTVVAVPPLTVVRV